MSGVDDPWSLINPVCYKEPLAPYPAALRARQPLSWLKVMRAFRLLSHRHRFLIVEGIGGLLVPLTRRRMVSDLIRQLHLPVLIVSRLQLGTLNHTLLTVQQAKRDGLSVLGVVLNATEAPSTDPAARLAERTNPSVLEACLSVPLLGVLPHRSALVNGSHSSRELVRWVARAMQPRFLEWLCRQGN
jgi:dethiobiotin synthetase